MIFLLSSLILTGSRCDAMGTVEIFHKNMPPSLETLERVEQVLEDYSDMYQIVHHLITDTASVELIAEYGLPETHFPFAVVVNGHFSAEIQGERVDFVHFPLFMHGIGRHEGNWSLAHLEMVLGDETLLLQENVLPRMDEAGATECMD